MGDKPPVVATDAPFASAVSYDFVAGAAARGAGLLRIGRKAARGREAGAAAQKFRNISSPSVSAPYVIKLCRTLQNFALSRNAKLKCSNFASENSNEM